MPNSKLIVKNTILLYFRMIVTMFVTLYTSRVVLDALGIVDYGLYNVVDGVVVMFTFLNGSLSSATLRFLNYGIGQNDQEDVNASFSTSIIIHIFISVIILILAETIGLWFVYQKLVIPEERFEAALCVYQISIISCIVTVLCAPYQSAIIAYERMDFYAYISIAECFLKLIIAYLISVCIYDKLIIYAVLLLGVFSALSVFKIWYCQNNFNATKIVWRFDMHKIKKLCGFSLWNMIGGLALIGVTQGTNYFMGQQ